MKRIFYFIAITLVMLSSCSKDEFAKILIQIEGIITNAKTGENVSNATVKIMTGGGEVTATTNEGGYFNIGDLTYGNYVVIVEKDSFLTSSFDVNSYGITRLEGNSREIINVELSLAPLSETKVITIYKFYSMGDIKTAAANVPYTLYLGQFNDPITGTTDDKGLLTLNNFPYTSSSQVHLDFDFMIDGIRYKEAFSSYYVLNNDYLNVHDYIEDGDLGLVSTNIINSKGEGVENFDINSNITITFTQPIDTTTSNPFYINSYYGGFNVNWSNNNMTATIIPLTSLLSDNSYQLSISVQNETNTDAYNAYISFRTR